MAYTSLSDGRNLFSGNSNNEEIWKILKVGKTFYFQSFNDLFYYDGKASGKIRFPSQVSYCYLIGGKVYVATVNNGVYILNGNSFIDEVQTRPDDAGSGCNRPSPDKTKTQTKGRVRSRADGQNDTRGENLPDGAVHFRRFGDLRVARDMAPLSKMPADRTGMCQPSGFA
jgi:hypothetical protein